MPGVPSQHSFEVKEGGRFPFGENWARFLAVLNDDRIREAEKSLREMLGVHDLLGVRFLDIGAGSGLFSLAARKLGATVYSFDYDPQSVACTEALRHRHFRADRQWTIETGSVLDEHFMAGLQGFDVVYAWGVLHHTGQMWRALLNVMPAVRAGGRLFIAIYNDQGLVSRYWYHVKRVYNRHVLFRWLIIGMHAPYLVGARWLARALTGRLVLERGMSLWHDMVDWLGGYPFEVAKPEAVIRFFAERGFMLENLKTCRGRMGCNEFIFRRQIQV